MLTRTLLYGLAALCLVVSAACSAEDVPAEPATLDELKAAIEAVLDKENVPAIGIAIVEEDGPVWVGALGKADVASGTGATADSLFRIGSVSKMFVALSVLKLVEEGRLSLDDKLADLAPEIEWVNPWETTDPIRVVHLLEHTTGWDDNHLVQFASSDPTPLTLKQSLDLHPHSRVSRWKPGTRSSYCNAGPPVAAYIVQKITGQDFESYVTKHLFEPMGMGTATYRLNADVAERGVTLYARGEPQDYWHISMRPSGAINASAKDMARFVSFLVGRGRVDDSRLISEASLERMESVGSTPAAAAGQETGYGLNNYSSIHRRWLFRSHGGGVQGGLTDLSYLPDAGRGYALSINSGNGKAIREIIRLVRSYLTRDLVPPASRDSIELAPVHTALAGLYRPINPRQELARFLDYTLGIHKLYVDGDKMALRPLLGGEPGHFLPVSERLFVDAESGHISMSAVQDPLAGPVVHWNTQVLEPVSPVWVYGKLAIAALWGLSILVSVPYLLVWGIRRLRGRVPPGATIRVRAWPTLAGLSFLAFGGLVGIGMGNPIGLLSKPTPISVGILVASVAFAIFAALGLVTAWRERATPMNRTNYWYSATSSLLHVLVVAYLFKYGIIGVALWA